MFKIGPLQKTSKKKYVHTKNISSWTWFQLCTTVGFTFGLAFRHSSSRNIFLNLKCVFQFFDVAEVECIDLPYEQDPGSGNIRMFQDSDLFLLKHSHKIFKLYPLNTAIFLSEGKMFMYSWYIFKFSQFFLFWFWTTS